MNATTVSSFVVVGLLWGGQAMADTHPGKAQETPDNAETEAMASSVEAEDDTGETEEYVETLTVVGERPLTIDERRRIYEELKTARRLYSQREFDKAFPYLIHTAEKGFKDSQAKVGHILLQGLGDVERDTVQAVGWLGVASSGRTAPTIRNYFNDVWKRIPEHYVPYFEEVVEEYKTKYGRDATGVVCDMHRPVVSYLPRLACFFEEDLPDLARRGLEDYKGQQHATFREQEKLRRLQKEFEVMRDLRR